MLLNHIHSSHEASLFTDVLQDALQRKLNFLKQEVKKIEMLLAEVHGVFQVGHVTERTL